MPESAVASSLRRNRLSVPQTRVFTRVPPQARSLRCASKVLVGSSNIARCESCGRWIRRCHHKGPFTPMSNLPQRRLVESYQRRVGVVLRGRYPAGWLQKPTAFGSVGSALLASSAHHTYGSVRRCRSHIPQPVRSDAIKGSSVHVARVARAIGGSGVARRCGMVQL